MNPETVLVTIRACAEAVSATMKWLESPQGQKVVEKSLADRAAWERFWSDAERSIQGLFSGKMFTQ